MNLLKQFYANLKAMLSDERKQAKKESFLSLTLTIERTLKRSLTLPELNVVWGLDEIQTEVMMKLFTEVNKG